MRMSPIRWSLLALLCLSLGLVATSLADALPSITLGPASALREGDAPVKCALRIPAILPNDLIITLTSSDPAQATVPATLTLTAGTNVTNFLITAVDDTAEDGAQPVTITASADGFTSGTFTSNVADNEVHQLELAPIAGPVIRNAPIKISLMARDINGAPITNFAGPVSLSAANAGGAISVTPATSNTFTKGVWTGPVYVGDYATGVQLTVSGAGMSLTSNAFDVIQGPFDHFGWAALPAQEPIDTPFPVTVSAVDAGGNLISDFSGSAALGVMANGPRSPTGIATSTSSGGTRGFNQVARVESIYFPGEVGAAGTLTAMELNFTAAPGSLGTLTIRLKHTAQNDTSAGWEGDDGWTVVYQAPTNVSAAGWAKFPFTIPFEYDGVSNLMVDISHTSPDFSGQNFSGGTYQTSPTTTARRIYFEGSIGYLYGDPLTWLGKVNPGSSVTALPVLRFSSYSAVTPLRLGVTGNFAGGIWSGSVSVPYAADFAKLVADDGQGHAGSSAAFKASAPLPPVGSGVIYAEGFENLPLAPTWKFTGTNTFRTRVANSDSPHGGSYHLEMDTSSFNTSSRNEATWTVDLAGMSGLTLSFWAKRFSVEAGDGPPPYPFTGGADFDGVAVSTNGTTWYEVQGLRSLTTSWTQYTVNLDAAVKAAGLSYTSSFLIRFNQYGIYPINSGGIAIDDIAITSAPSLYPLKLTAPAQLAESAPPAKLKVSLPFSVAADTVVSLRNSSPEKLLVPAQVTIPAGQVDGYVTIQAINDTLADGSKAVSITASNPYFGSGSATLTIQDDDGPNFIFSAPTTSTVEGAGTLMATITVASPPAAPLVFSIATSDATAISVPATVTLPAGALSVPLPLTVVNDSKLDGTQTATVTVSVPGFTPQSLTFSVDDNETHDLRLQPTATLPAIVAEGRAALAFTATLPGSVTTATTVTFTSSNPARVAPPAPITIAAGVTSGSGAFTFPENSTAEAAETITLTASAPGFNSATSTFTLLDNDPDHFVVSPIPSPQIRGAAFPVTVTAVDVTGATLPGFSGQLTFSTGGVSLQSSMISLVAGVWSGTVRENDFFTAGVLTAQDAAGHTGVSNAFDSIRGPLAGLAWDPISIPQAAGQNIPVSLRAVDAGGNIISTVNGPATVQSLSAGFTFTIGNWTSAYAGLLNPTYATTRAECLYLASELGGARTLGGLALSIYDGAAGQRLTNFTIRIKATSLTSLSNTTDWDNTGWTTVLQGNPTLDHNDWNTFLFDVPFVYDGQSNLLVDISFNSASSKSVSYRYVYASPPLAAGNSTSTTSNPLLWSGTSPGYGTTTDRPQTQFLTLLPNPPSPLAVQLSDGLWQGSVSFPGNLNPAFLQSQDAGGNFAFSNRLVIATPVRPAATLPFFDGFESGSFSSYWTLDTTGGGQVKTLSTSSAASPHTGAQQAGLDANLSVGPGRSELTLSLDLDGYSGVTLSFWAKRLGGTADGPPPSPFLDGADFDGVAISADGHTWFEVQSLRDLPLNTWSQLTVNLDAAAAAHGLSYSSNFFVRFNAYCTYSINSQPIDGITLDDVSVTGSTPGQLQLTTPANAPGTGTVALPTTAAAPVTVTLTSLSPLLLSVPPSVTIPAGSQSASFPLTNVDNPLANGLTDVTISASAPGFSGALAVVHVTETHGGTLSLSLPASATESHDVTGTLTLSPPPSGTVTVALSSDSSAATVPASVTVPAGAASVTFPITLPYDYYLTGTKNCHLTATLSGWTSATASLAVLDQNTATLSFVNNPMTIKEGTNAQVSIQLGGGPLAPVTVSFTSGNPSRLTVPATTTLATGFNGGSVTFTAVEDSAFTGSVTVPVTMSAPGLGSATINVTILDNDADHYSFAALPLSVVKGAPVPVTIQAQDISNNAIGNNANVLTLTATGTAGPISISPSSITLASGTWSGNVTLGTFSSNVRITARDATAHTGISSAFAVTTGPTTHYSWSTIASPQNAGQPFTATITALDAGNNLVTAQNGYAFLSAPASERTMGSGTSTSTAFPIASAAVERTQAIYLASELGGTGPLTSLSLYVNVAPAQSLTAWTIRLKSTTLTTYSFQPSWDTTGWTTVYSASPAISSTGWVTFYFSTPFSYDGTSNLLVDLSYKNASSITNTPSVRVYSTSGSRTLYGSASSISTYGDPLNWTGNFGTTNSTVPQLKFNSGFQPATVAPAAVLLTNGTWTGPLWLRTATTGNVFIATDFNGNSGISNAFAVTPLVDGDADGLPDSWETANGLLTGNATGDNGALGDRDHDGIPNFLEYALNLNPGIAGTDGLPMAMPRLNPADDLPYLEFTYRRRIGAASITYTVETSSDCKTWTADPSFYQQVGGPLPTGDGVSETVTVRVLPAITAPGGAARFARMKVTSP